MMGNTATGDFNKRIILQSFIAKTDDDIGNHSSEWKDFYKCWASVNCVGGREYYRAAQSNSQNDMIFKIRYSKAISEYDTSEIRIVYNGKIYNIKHIDDYMQQHRELVIRADEINGRG